MKRTLIYTVLLFLLAPIHSLVSQEEEGVETEEERAVGKEVEEIAEEATEGDLASGPIKLSLEGMVNLNYVFAESPDNFIVKYNFKVEETIRNQVDVKKGNMEITIQTEGFLKKWTKGECLLQVSTGKIPYELIFNRTSDEEARIDFKLKESILEKWESNCSFSDSTGKKVSTTGDPEKWLDPAIQKCSPSLRRLKIPLNSREATQTTCEIKQHQLPDIPIGSVEIEGKTVVKLEPQ